MIDVADSVKVVPDLALFGVLQITAVKQLQDVLSARHLAEGEASEIILQATLGDNCPVRYCSMPIRCAALMPWVHVL